jgi:hypothetical protein
MAPSPSPLGRWKVSFESLTDNGNCNPVSGFLLLWLNNWLTLVNHKDSPLVGKSLRDGEVFFYPGSSIRFPSHLVFVQECLVSPPGFSSFSEPTPLRWRVTYSALGKMDSKIPMGKSAFLILKSRAKRIILVDPKEQVISARFLLQGEHIVTGHILDFKDHSVLVGEYIGSSDIALEDNFHASGPKSINITRSFVDVVNSSKHLNASSLPEAPPVRWKVTYSHF